MVAVGVHTHDPYKLPWGGSAMSGQTVPPTSSGEINDDVSTDNQSLSRTEIFDVLSNQRRRYILHYLKQREKADFVDLRDIVDQVAAWECETTVDQLDSAERKRVYTAIRQSHLPKLHDVGVVEYNNKRGTVELTDTAREVEVYLEYVPEHDISWSQYYLGLSGISSLIIGAMALEIWLFGNIPPLGLATLIVGLFVLSSGVHVYYTRQSRLGADGPPEDK